MPHFKADGRSDAEEDDDDNEEEDEDDDDEWKGELESTSNSTNKDFDESTPSINELEHATATYVITPSSAYEEPKYTTSYTTPIDSTRAYETSTTVPPVYEVQNKILPYWLRSSTY